MITRICSFSAIDMIQWSGVICILLLMTTVGVVSPLKCPSSASDWDRASRGLQCQPPNFYHCLRDESGVNTEQCVPRVWIQPHMCPEFNSRVSRVDVYQCTVTNCPTSLYWSNAVFMYPICFENGSATLTSKPGSTVTTTALEKTSLFEHHFRSTKASVVLEHTPTYDKSKDSGDESPTDESLPVGALGSIIGVIVLCVVGVLIILVYLKRRRRKGNNEEQPDADVRNEVIGPPENEEKENKINEINETSNLLEQADGNVTSEVSKQTEKVEKENETSNLLGNESTSELKESVKVGCQVYVVESQKPNEQTSVPKDESSVRVLVLVLNKPINSVEMNSKAKETLGKNYYYCWTLSYYQEHKQKESVPLFPKNFDFERASGKEICEKIRDVGLERDVNFVITVPLSVWSAQREELSSFLNADINPCFKTEYW
ncbi:uncharacterized protein LOC134239885 isoform X3 [Saccostrea cucullata]|uniref:uncharacterized protein LOC134239885 isoform X3 n=1 Tax=Saccostrea cuccullata TaxID=36930 RepID=UPI002ED58DBD